MGLLTKVNDKKLSLIDKKKNQISDFLEKAESLHQGFEYGNKLLQLFSDLMGFNKAALLVSEQCDKLFVPVSYMNIDITTVRHLRIQHTVFSVQFNNYCQKLNKNNKKLKKFKQYFSIREFSILSSIALVPFYSNSLIESVLLIIDPSEDAFKLCREITLKSEKFILKLYNSRKPFSNNLKIEYEDKSSDPALLLQKIITSIKNNNSISLIIITLNFESLKNAIMDYLPNVEPYTISNDIIKAILRLINPNGEIYKISSVKCLLFYKIKKGKSPDIIIHQLNVAISTFFNLSASLPDINTSVTVIDPEETENANNILAGLL